MATLPNTIYQRTQASNPCRKRISTPQAAVVGIVITLVAGDEENNLNVNLYILALCSMVFYVLASLFSARLQAMHRVVLAKSPLGMGLPLLMILGIWFASVMLHGPLSAIDAMTIRFVAIVLILIVVYRVVKNNTPNEVTSSRADYKTNQWVKNSVSLFLVSVFFVVISQSSIVFVGILLDDASAGIIAAASKIAALVAFGLNVINVISAPMLSRSYHSGSRADLQKVAAISALASSCVAIPVALFFVVYSEDVLGPLRCKNQHEYQGYKN